MASALAILAATWAASYLYVVPFIDWILVLYPFALVVGWCGAGWLRGQALGARVSGVTAWIRRHGAELLVLAAITAASLAMHVWLAYQYPLTHGSVHDKGFVGLRAWQLTRRTSPWLLYQTMGDAAAFFQPLSLVFGAGTAAIGALCGSCPAPLAQLYCMW